MTQLGTTLAPLVERVYGDRAAEVTARLVDLAARWRPRLSARRPLPFDNRTSVLITYGNTVRRPGEPGLCTLAEVLAKDVGAVVSDVHLLPLYPSTSDDGFAVVDHRRIDARLGDWEDVAALGATHGVILDFVANHVSASSPWFRAFLAGDPAYADFFVTRDPAFDASQVVRPRTTPLFHTYRRPDGSPVEVWTTFGPDQVDVNVANPEVLLALTDILLGYVARGARAVRLDAIGFLWKASGTRCIHLPQTHAIIKLWRVLLDGLAPGTCLLTETNVPHLENVAYFGNGSDEANLVYQFALPPLTLHSFVAGDASALTGWASAVGRVSGTATWFNFLASHDGIGMRASHGILDESQQEALVERTRAVGGRVSLAATADGSEVYELNVAFLDALCTPAELRVPALAARKAVAAHAILLSMLGVPAIYVHSLLGSASDLTGMDRTGLPRRVNRAALDADLLARDLRDDPRRRQTFTGIARLLRVRREHPAFDPFGEQRVHRLDSRIVAVERWDRGGRERLCCLVNVSAQQVAVPGLEGVDVLTGRECRGEVGLAPYGVAWIRREPTAL